MSRSPVVRCTLSLCLVLCMAMPLLIAGTARAAATQYESAGVWPKTTWHLKSPRGAASDASGNVYVADTGNNRVVKFDAAGRYVTAWGGAGQESGKFNQPWDVACDPSGESVFVADTMNHRIQQFSVKGKSVTFVRKWGKAGGPDYTGSNSGEFNEPRGIARDAQGNVYIVDTKNYRVQKFAVGGSGISFVRQWGTAGSDVDKFLQPWALDVSPNGTVYILDRDKTNCYVRAFTPDGKPVAFPSGGNGWGSYNLTKSPGRFARPEGIAVDDDGNVYVADNGIASCWIQKFTFDGEWLGGWGRLAHGDVDDAQTPLFRSLCGMDASGAGTAVRLIAADYENDRLREFDGDGAPLSARDGLGVLGSHGVAWWRFNEPRDVEMGPSGSVYIADRMNHRIQRMSPSGEVDRIAPTVIPASARLDNGYFSQPSAVAYDPVSEFVFVAEAGNNRIQRLTADLVYEGHKWGAIGTAAGAFNQPQGVAVGPGPDGKRWVYVSDTGNNRVQVFELDGTPKGQFGSSTLLAPAGIVVDDEGSVFVVDSGHRRVVKFVPNLTWSGWTLASAFGTSGSGDAVLAKPWGLALDDSGVLYVSDTEACKVKKYSKVSGAFAGALASKGTSKGQLDQPRGVAVSPQGIVYVADTVNDRYQAFVQPIEISVTSPADGGMYNSDVTPSVVYGTGAVDVGVDMDGAPWTGEPISSEGVHVLRAWAKDTHGLIHERVVQFTIDYHDPSTSSDARDTYSNQARISLAASDDLSGVETTYWRLDGGSVQSGSLVVVNKHGDHLLEYWSIDRAGNVEPHQFRSFKVNDTIPPFTTSNATSQYVGRASITLTPTDAGSAVTATYYRLDGGATTKATTVATTKLGAHTLEYWSVDAQGNTEVPKTARFTVTSVTSLSFYAPTTSAYRSAKVYGYLRYTNSSGTLTPLSGKNVYIQHYSAGAWRTVAKAVTSSTGRYSYTVNPSVKTTYRARYYGNSTYLAKISAKRYILPRLHFTSAPRNSTYTHTYGKSYKVWGYFKPKHSSGSTQIKVLAYRKTKQPDGTYKYVYKKTFYTKVSNPSGSAYSKYTGYVKLPSRGKWRLRARHIEDSKNARSYTSYRYVYVK